MKQSPCESLLLVKNTCGLTCGALDTHTRPSHPATGACTPVLCTHDSSCPLLLPFPVVKGPWWVPAPWATFPRGQGEVGRWAELQASLCVCQEHDNPGPSYDEDVLGKVIVQISKNPTASSEKNSNSERYKYVIY